METGRVEIFPPAGQAGQKKKTVEKPVKLFFLAYKIHLNTNQNINTNMCVQIKIKSSLYSPYYAEACNELRGPSPRLSAWATQLRRNVTTVASRWRHCVGLTAPGIEPQTYRTDSVRLATDLTAGQYVCFKTLMKNGINKSRLLKTKVCFLFTFIQILFLLGEILRVQTSSDKVSANYSLSSDLLNTEHKPSVKKNGRPGWSKTGRPR